MCNRDEGPAVVICFVLITPTEGIHTQETEVEAAYGGSFEQTLFFFVPISVIIWIFS